MAFTQIQSSQTDAKSPIDEQLMDVGLRQNFDDHESRLLALEGGGGGGGGAGEDLKYYGEILGDVKNFSNEGAFWMRRYHPFASSLGNGANPEGVDLESRFKNDRFFFKNRNEVHNKGTSSGFFYLGNTIGIAIDASFSFKLKKGENFFGISFVGKSDGADLVDVFIDGQTPTALSLIDENGGAKANQFSTVRAATKYQTLEWFYGLDGHEHTITINVNSASVAGAEFDSVYAGFKSPSYTIDHTIKVNSGKAKVRGGVVSHVGGSFSFTKSRGYGHTGAIVSDGSGNLSKLDGLEPAMSQVRAENEVAFSGAVTTLPLKNTYFFPDNGIGILSTPFGNHHLFSWTSKTETTIQGHSLNGIIWKSKPKTNFNPMTGFTATVKDAYGDLNVNFWASAPVIISASNNKLDFKVKIGGAYTTHAAAIDNGAYAADLVSICDAIVKAMNVAKPLDEGNYFCEWDESEGLYRIGVNSNLVEELHLLFSSGANFASSIHSTLGFGDTDLTAAKAFTGITEKRHKAARAMDFDPQFMSAQDPRIKFSGTGDGTTPESDDVERRLGLGKVRVLNNVDGDYAFIFPDPDAVGLVVYTLQTFNGSMIMYTIDNGLPMYLTQNDRGNASDGGANRGAVMSAVITFPRGSRVITVKNMYWTAFHFFEDAENLNFVGCRQLFTRPKAETITKNQSILKAYDIAPLQLFGTPYGHNSGNLYSPQASGDNINTITESGSWTGTTTGDLWNQGNRYTSTLGDYVEIDFTLQGNGGGFKMLSLFNTNQCKKSALFLSQAAINESTDRIQNVALREQAFRDQWCFEVFGLPAGTYKCRIKNEASGDVLTNQGFMVVDTVPPEENKYTQADVTNSGQGVSFPLNTIKETDMRDHADRVPEWLRRTGYKEGRPGKCFNQTGGYAEGNYDNSSSMVSDNNRYFANHSTHDDVNGLIDTMALCKSVTALLGEWAGASPYNLTMIPFIDGR